MNKRILLKLITILLCFIATIVNSQTLPSFSANGTWKVTLKRNFEWDRGNVTTGTGHNKGEFISEVTFAACNGNYTIIDFCESGRRQSWVGHPDLYYCVSYNDCDKTTPNINLSFFNGRGSIGVTRRFGKWQRHCVDRNNGLWMWVECNNGYQPVTTGIAEKCGYYGGGIHEGDVNLQQSFSINQLMSAEETGNSTDGTRTTTTISNDGKNINIIFDKWFSAGNGTWQDVVTITRIGEECDLDSDNDGLLDLWEKFGYDPDGNPSNGIAVPLKEMGADPFRKDIFLEIDCMSRYKEFLTEPVKELLVNAFDKAKTKNITGVKSGINLHINVGDILGVVEDYCTFDVSSGVGIKNYFDIKRSNFQTTNLNKIFHYCVFAKGAINLDRPPQSILVTGLAYRNTNAMIVSLNSLINDEQAIQNVKNNPVILASIIMHELGHNLGLGHGGNEDKNSKPNYLSVMNYLFGTGLPGGKIDYSSEILPELNENSLLETDGIGKIAKTKFYFQGSPSVDQFPDDPDRKEKDWNLNDVIDANRYPQDLNGDRIFDKLTGHNDWENVVLPFKPINSASELLGLKLDDRNFDTSVLYLNNIVPIANAGRDTTVNPSCSNIKFSLNGIKSFDPDGSISTLNYLWTGSFIEGGGQVKGINPIITLPIGVSTVILVVNDGLENSKTDTIKITVPQAIIGDACNDNNPNTTNDKVQTDCTCRGETVVTYDCPTLQKNKGDACNDNNPNTTNDKIQSDCTCRGEAVQNGALTINCPQNITVNVASNVNAAVVSWATPSVATTCTTGGGGATCTGAAISGCRYLGKLGNSEYYLSNEIQQWTTARQLAISKGGYLAIISNQAENNFLASVIGNATAAYIGLSDDITEGVFKWVDGTTATYTNWESFAPRNNSTSDEDFVVMHGWSRGKWADYSRYVAKQYIIEKPCSGTSGGGSSAVTVNQTSGLQNGTSFPIGSQSIVYTASDACGNTQTCSFTVTVERNGGGGSTTCTEYTLDNTNQRCNPATYIPFALQIGSENLKSEAATLQKRSDGTAILRGSFRDATWRVVNVTLNLSGGTATGTATKTGCLTTNSPTTDWTLYPIWSGTIQRAGQTPLSITGSSAFQIGTGASTQDATELGGYGRFNTTTAGQTGVFAFKLQNPTNCPIVQNASSKTIFETRGQSIFDKIQLNWYENTAEVSELFKIEKANSRGEFELLDYIKSQIGNGTRTYTTVDKDPTEGDNLYKISLLKNDGSEKTKVVSVKFEKVVYAQVFPNPTDGRLDVLLNSAVDSEVSVQVYNAVGHLVQNVKAQQQLIHLDLSDSAVGLYLIRVSQKGKRDFTKQVVLQK